MYKFNKILVGLDHTPIDKDLISAAAELCTLSNTKQVFFVNVIKDFDLPDNLKKEFPNLITTALSDRKREIDESIKKHFHNDSVDIQINVVVEQGSVTKSLLKLATKEKIDLFVLGRKDDKKVGVLVTRIARRAPCSLLIIPKGKKVGFKNIFVPTDFSEYAKKAMEKAVTLARRSEGSSKLMVQNVYQVPTGYHYTGKSFKDFGQIMKDNAAVDYKRFMANFKIDGLDVEPIYSLDKNDDIISVIVKEAKKSKADIVIIGAKGRTATAALFIGSKAERMVQLNDEIPMLVIRPKGKGAGVFDYIKDL